MGFSRLIVSHSGSTFTFWQPGCFTGKPRVVLLTRHAYFLTPKLYRGGYIYNLEILSTYNIIYPKLKLSWKIGLLTLASCYAIMRENERNENHG